MTKRTLDSSFMNSLTCYNSNLLWSQLLDRRKNTQHRGIKQKPWQLYIILKAPLFWGQSNFWKIKPYNRFRGKKWVEFEERFRFNLIEIVGIKAILFWITFHPLQTAQYPRNKQCKQMKLDYIICVRRRSPLTLWEQTTRCHVYQPRV